MRKVHIGRDCACGCSRKTEVGQYAYWHVNNGIPELQKPCACGCGKLTTGKVHHLTRELHQYLWAHGATAIRRSKYEALCQCGCGRKASYGGYSEHHIYEPIPGLAMTCRCGCGQWTSGKIGKDGQPVEYVEHHAGWTDKEKKLCRCGCRKRTSIGDYANWHVLLECESLKQKCACGCGGMTSGRVNIITRKPAIYLHRHSAKPYKNGNSVEYRTNLEKMVEDVLVELEEEYVFDTKFGPYWPDFLLPNRRVILEADGDYWHSDDKRRVNESSREAYFRNRGWTVIRLKEKDIKQDARACVTGALGIPNL